MHAVPQRNAHRPAPPARGAGEAGRGPAKGDARSRPRRYSLGRFLKWGAALCGGIAFLVIGTVVLWPGLLKPIINRAASAATGREFAIDGMFSIHLGSPLVVEATDIRLANPAWSTEKNFLSVRRARFHIRPLPLFRGRVEIPEIRLTGPRVALERSENGEESWTIGNGSPESQDGSVVPTIGLLGVEDGMLRYIDHAAKDDVSLALSTERDADGVTVVTTFKADGTYRANQVKASGKGGALLALSDNTKPFPLDATVSIGDTGATIHGTITSLSTFQKVDANMELHGKTLSALFPIVGITLPPTHPYRIKGRLVHEGVQWSLLDFAGTVGKSDLSGDFRVSIDGERPSIKANTVSKTLDLAELQGFAGKAPETKGSDPESKSQRAAAARQEASSKAIPEDPWRLARLRAVDADFVLDAKSIQGISNPLESLKMHFVLKDGAVTIDPLDFGTAGGTIASKVRLDASKDVPRMSADAEFRRLTLGKLFPGNETLERTSGVVGGRFKLQGRGRSAAELLASANGDVGLASTGGRISDLLLHVLQLHAADTLRILVLGDKEVGLRCLAAHFHVRDGMLSTDFFVVDTSSSVIFTEGNVNLGKEQLDLTITPESKKIKIFSATSPIRVTGRFKDPEIYPDPKALAVRGGIGAALAFLNPLAGLIALIDPAGGRDQSCGDFLDEVKERADVKESSLQPKRKSSR